MMTTIYMCDTCGKTYSNVAAAAVCELSHQPDSNQKKAYVIKLRNLDPCNYCARAYYVYGCERNCDCEKNCKNYSLFVSEE